MLLRSFIVFALCLGLLLSGRHGFAQFESNNAATTIDGATTQKAAMTARETLAMGHGCHDAATDLTGEKSEDPAVDSPAPVACCGDCDCGCASTGAFAFEQGMPHSLPALAPTDSAGTPHVSAARHPLLRPPII